MHYVYKAKGYPEGLYLCTSVLCVFSCVPPCSVMSVAQDAVSAYASLLESVKREMEGGGGGRGESRESEPAERREGEGEGEGAAGEGEGGSLTELGEGVSSSLQDLLQVAQT